MHDPIDVLNRVRGEFRKRWNIWWLAPLGFDNSYALALRRDRAEALKLRTITDLVRVAPQLKAVIGLRVHSTIRWICQGSKNITGCSLGKWWACNNR